MAMHFSLPTSLFEILFQTFGIIIRPGASCPLERFKRCWAFLGRDRLNDYGDRLTFGKAGVGFKFDGASMNDAFDLGW